MNNLTTYNSPDFGQIRTTIIDGEPWFIAADVCRCLDIGNPSQALTRLDDDEKNTVILNEGIRGNPEKAIVSEPGLYKLIMSSRKPEAKAFTRWITSRRPRLSPTAATTDCLTSSTFWGWAASPLRGLKRLLKRADRSCRRSSA